MTAENGGAVSGPEIPNEEQGTPNDNNRISKNSESAVPPVAPAKEHTEDEDERARAERHRRAEGRHWTFEKVVGLIALPLTAGAVGGALASAIFANKALIASQNFAAADQRPWIGGPTKIVRKPISAQILTFTHTFKNVGKTATTGLYIDAKSMNNENDSWYGGAKHMCEKADTAVKTPFTSIPGAEWVIDLKQMPESSRTNIELNALKKMSDPYIVGCVSYTSPFDIVIHHTGYGTKIIPPDMSIQYIYTVDAN
jgi:hypothetical protein